MFQKLSEVELYRNSVISLVKALFSTHDGSVFERDVVRHLGAVSIVPLLEDNKSVLLLSQFRASLGRNLIEVPAGKRDVANEPPQIAAIRELEEEMGLRCSALIKLGEFDNSPGFTDEHSFSYLARGLTLGQMAPQSIEEVESSIISVELSKVQGLISDGIISDAKTIIGLSRVAGYLSSGPQERDMLYPIAWSSNKSTFGTLADSDEVAFWSHSLPRL